MSSCGSATVLFSVLCAFSNASELHTATPYGPGAGPWEFVEPEAVGLSGGDLDKALTFINENVKGRQCFLLVKDGKIAYEWYDAAPDPADTPVSCDVAPTPSAGKLYAVAQVCTDEPKQKGWTYDSTTQAVKWMQQWCLDATLESQLAITDCNATSPAQRFSYVPSAGFILSADGKCVDIVSDKGPKLQLAPCTGRPNQHFTFNTNDTSVFSGKSGQYLEIQRCLQVTSADPADPQCRLGETFGCEGSNSMWVMEPCQTRQFKCNGRIVDCVPSYQQPGYKTTCNCDLENKPHEGYSMTKSIGAYIIFLAATQDGLDIDADITTKYGIPSPKPYSVTLRMMMSQVIGGDHRAGELWRYDEMGDMWMHLMPKVVESATGHPASYYMGQLSKELGLSPEFAWKDVNTQWYRGMQATCRDWARFGQLLNNQGYWGGKQLIAKTYFEQMVEPTKYAPYNDYSNPCYGLLVWNNANKSKHPGCCWEASRLPEPKCNNETFMDGAVNDMSLIIGLYGQIAMTLPSVNAVVVGFGTDLRPIEPARIGYYPALCKPLGIPCNTPQPIPKPKCGEKFECTGMAAQCFSGGAWNHSEPTPGHEQCIRCFQERLPQYEAKFPEAHDMVKNYCPTTPSGMASFLHCFCYTNSSPFSPWPTTTTTTLQHGPFPPLPSPVPTPAPPQPRYPCLLSAGCVEAVHAFKCERNKGSPCVSCLHQRQSDLSNAGCPDFGDGGFASRGFCWCGPNPSEDVQIV